MTNVVYDSLATDEFEMTWKNATVQFDLEDNEWLEGHCTTSDNVWFLLMSKVTFGQECQLPSLMKVRIYAFFDGYVNSQATLKQFVD